MDAPQAKSQPSAKAKWLGCSLGGLGGMALFAIVIMFSPVGLLVHILVGQNWCEWRNEDEFSRHRDRYEAIVRAISGMSIARGESISLLIAPDKDPATMRVIDHERESELFSRSNETNLISAHRTREGRLTVRICTYSMGHAGVYGLYYSSGLPAKDEVENSFGMDGRIRQVAPDWWRVSDYSQ